MYALVFAGSVLMAATLATIVYAEAERLSPLAKCAVCGIHFLAALMAFCPPVAMFVHVVTAYSLGVLNVCLKEYSRELCGSGTEDKGAHAKKMVNAGYRLHAIVRQANDMFAGPLYVEHCTAILTEICSVYYFLGFVAMFLTQEYYTAQVFYGAQALILVAFSVMRRLELSRAGQGLANAFSAVKLAIQDLSGRDVDSLDERAKTHLGILAERFTCDAPISPFYSFSMNMSSGLSVDGLIVTYIIVLMQFRLA